VTKDQQARNAEMCALYAAGETLEQIGSRYELTRERVRQILKQTGGASADDARERRREIRSDLLGEAVSDFLGDFGETVRVLAASGRSRSEVEERFKVLVPSVSSAVVRDGIDSLGVVFNVDVQDLNFSDTVVAEALWFTAGREMQLEPAPLAALASPQFDNSRELSKALRSEGLTAEQIADVIAVGAAAKAAATDGSLTPLSKKAYDQSRLAVLVDFRLSSRKGKTPWPPTSQTVMKRLGGGYWSDALAAVGLTAGDGGRARGLLVFAEGDYESAVSDYLAHVSVTGQSDTFAGYGAWVEDEERAGRRRPSSAAVRLRFINWTNAKRKHGRVSREVDSGGGYTGWGGVATAGLVRAEAETAAFAESAKALTPVEVSNRMAQFVRSFVEEFEIRRREWLRGVVSLDPSATSRRMANPQGLSKAQRTALVTLPLDWDAVLPDRYCDGLLTNSDPTDAGSWLLPALQAELDSVSEEARLRFAVLRALRNFFTHDSAESTQRLTMAIGALAASDPRFELGQPVTRRVINDWLRSQSLRRLGLLTSCVPVIWRAMVVVEALAATP